MRAAAAIVGTIATALFAAGCASLDSLGSLGRLVQPPTFAEAENQPAEIRLLGPGADRPLGGATVRIWTRVTNPNPFGFRLATLRTTLLLDGARAATGDFPLGLPLAAREETVVPLDLAISFSNLAGLSRVVRSAAEGQPVPYQLEGTIGVDAGRLGQPTFGPMQLVTGELSGRVRRVGPASAPQALRRGLAEARVDSSASEGGQSTRPTGSGDYLPPAAELVPASSGRSCASRSASVICPG